MRRIVLSAGLALLALAPVAHAQQDGAANETLEVMLLRISASTHCGTTISGRSRPLTSGPAFRDTRTGTSRIRRRSQPRRARSRRTCTRTSTIPAKTLAASQASQRAALTGDESSGSTPSAAPWSSRPSDRSSH